MQKPFVILFAGPVGSSKSTIANFLSWNLNLPIFSNDSVRREVVLENKAAEGKDYLERRNKYLSQILSSSKNFILDASIDRSWSELKEKLTEYNYNYFIISIDVSEDFLKRFLERFDYSMNNADKNYKEHLQFLKEHQKEIGVSINDGDFNNRLEISLKAANKFLNER